MYKYLLWDIDGTILNFLESERCAIKELFSRYNLGPCSDETVELYSKINIKYWGYLEKGIMTKPEILHGRFFEFFDMLGIDKSITESFNLDYQKTLGDYTFFMPGAREVLLKQKGTYRLCAVTNGTKMAQTKKLAKSGLDKIFDAVYISEDIGYEKPSAEFFEHVFKCENITDKKSALIIGDSLTSDIKGGLLFGIDTCWYNPFHKENKENIKATYEIDDLSLLDKIVR